ncbi:MAG: hypothetical protein Q4F95_15035 [Oscillospiraceae bacterium]|nr:hypothetical protein [Oscillospiraceae bacterium]
MTDKKNLSWSRLDNAAKVFPSTTQKTDTRVFRFGCELKFDVDSQALQDALDKTIQLYPHFLCVMRKGVFWYYLEQTELKPVVKEEYKPICDQLYKSGERNLLFEVTYYKNRINFEAFHVLTDGTGAMNFLKTLVLNYIIGMYGDRFGENVPFLDDTSSLTQRVQDGFTKYYQKQKRVRIRSEHAFRLHRPKRENDDLLIIEGITSVRSLLQTAHKYNTTLTILLTAFLIEAFHQEMSLQNKNLPVSIGVPVNLRNYFPSETARNFFAMINVKYSFGERSGELEDIIKVIKQSFEECLTAEKLSEGMNSYAVLEHNTFIRLAPLPLKDAVIRYARMQSDKGTTAVISNIGQIKMPEGLSEYINLFYVFASTMTQQLCVCSYGDKLVLGFSSAFTSTEVIKNFFMQITRNDIPVTINCNDFNSRGV